MAKQGAATDPVQPAPPALRRYLGFAKLPAPALDITRKVLEEDDEFRSRVVAALSEAEVGEAGWLWLTRPPGWEARLETLQEDLAERQRTEQVEREERSASRKLVASEAARQRAETAHRTAAVDLQAAKEAARQERDAREQADQEVAALRATVAELREQRQQAVRRLKDVEAEAANRAAAFRRLRAEQAATTAPEPPPAPDSEVPPAESTGESGESGGSAPAPAVEALDRPALAEAVRAAATAAAELSRALASASALLDDGGGDAGETGDGGLAEPRPGAGGTVTGAAGPERARGPRRRPLRLPPGVFDDSVEAATSLLRAPNVLLLVDGYNVSIGAWPGLPIAQQRSRLIDALAELHARYGSAVDVVFDGAETTGPVLAGPTRRSVHVRFSPPGVEADDVVLSLVDEAPAHRPVVVASSDRRVRDGSRRLGANTLTSAQLLGALRR